MSEDDRYDILEEVESIIDSSDYYNVEKEVGSLLKEIDCERDQMQLRFLRKKSRIYRYQMLREGRGLFYCFDVDLSTIRRLL